jgi:hypothetical protein
MVGTIRVKIAINVNDAFQGVLRCATHVDSIPLSFKSVKLIPLNELGNRKVGRTTMLEPLPTKHSSELDISTLHMLLTTMQSALILTDRKGQQYLFRSRSISAATITPYGGPPKPSSRLVRSLSVNKDLDTHLEPSIKYDPKDKLELDKLAWFHVLEKNDGGNTADTVQQACKDCIAHNTPTPLYLATQIIPSAILGTTDLIDTDEMNRIVSALWMTLTAIQGRVRNPNRVKDEVLRVIQTQLLLRLQLLAMDAAAFLHLYSTKLMDRRKRKAGMPSDVMTQIIAIVEQAPFLLDLGTTLLQFLHDTIPTSIYCSIPDQVQEIFDFFECANPFVSLDDEDTHFSSVEEGERPPKKKVRITEDLSKPQHEDRILQSIDLTSNVGRRINPLLKDAKGVYVGSHFNTKLANMSAHYHEVQRVPLVRQHSSHEKRSPLKRSPAKKSKVQTKSALKPHENNRRGSTSGQQSPFARRGRITTYDMYPVTKESSEKERFLSLAQIFSVVGQEDPSLTTTKTSNCIVGETPIKTRKEHSLEVQLIENNRFVEETPVKTDNHKENRAVPFTSPLRALENRKPFSVPTNARTKQQGQCSLEKRSLLSEARQVAQQARAAVGRGRR